MKGYRLPYRKYRAKATEIDGIRFPSKKEAEHYRKLCLARQSGELTFFLRQVPFHLPGNTKHLIDFVEFWKDGTVNFVEIKGYDTPMGKMKRKMVESIYPIKIEVIK